MGFLGELVVKITGDDKQFSSTIKKAEDTTKAFDDRLKKTGNQVKELGSRLSFVASAPILGLFITSLNTLKSSTADGSEKMKDMDKTVKNLQISLGQALLPVVTTVTDIIKDFASWFEDLDAGQKNTIVTVGLLVAALGPLLAIIGTFMSMGIVGLFATLATVVIGVTVAIANSTTAAAAQGKTFEKGSEQTRAYIKSLKELKAETQSFQDKIEEMDTTQLQKQLTLMNANIKDTQASLTQMTKGEWYVPGSSQEIERQNKLNKFLYERKLILEKLAEIAKGNQDVEDAALEKKNKIQGAVYAEAIRIQELNDFIFQTDLANEEARTEAVKKANEEKLASYTAMGEGIMSTMGPVLESFGALLVTGAEGWEAFKKAGLNAIASLVEAQAKEWGLKAIAAAGEVFLGNIAAGAAAVQYGLASAGAFVASGVIRSLKEGALVQPQAGGEIVRVAEAGYPEYVVPERQDYMARLASLISAEMRNNPIVNNNSYSPTQKLQIGSKEFNAYVTEEIAAGRIRLNPKAIQKRY
jgi:TolA-binding protein